MTKYPKFLIMFNLLILILQVQGQTPHQADASQKRNVIWFTPSHAEKINGISIGLVNTPGYHKQTCNGLSLELIGAGYITLFLGLDDGGYVRNTRQNLTNNGIISGPTLFSGKVNGVAVSAITGTNYYLNGFSFSLVNLTLFQARGLITGLVTSADVMKGIQIGVVNISSERSRGIQLGLLNRANDLKGLQVGLWNINEKRSMPFFNW